MHHKRTTFASLALCLAGLLWVAGCADGNPGGNDNNSSGNNNSNVQPGTLQLGESCSASAECESTLCLGVGQELLCSKPCENDPCPDGFYCAYVDVQMAPAGEDVPTAGFYCLPDRGGLCKPCGSDINCTFAGDRCLDLGNGAKVCGRDCQHNGFCPTGFDCRQGQCWPIMNTCDCIPERVGATRSCAESNEYGVCQGVQTCQTEGWDECSAGIPSFEVCNGEDDDCDGEIPTDERDNNGNDIIDCMEGCTPSPEVCDSEDNDCNGVVDDGDMVDMCGSGANGEVVCLHGECVIGSCDPGFVDLDEDVSNGCECALNQSGSDTCTLAEVIPPMSEAGGGSTEVRTGILNESEEAWYYVQAVDDPDDGPNGCDEFHFRVQFTVNPDGAYVMDVLGEQCGGTDECGQAVVDFQIYRNFRDESNINDPKGECPCALQPGEGENQCTSQDKVYLIRVHRLPGLPLTCSPYELEFTNGIYPSPI